MRSWPDQRSSTSHARPRLELDRAGRVSAGAVLKELLDESMIELEAMYGERATKKEEDEGESGRASEAAVRGGDDERRRQTRKKQIDQPKWTTGKSDEEGGKERQRERERWKRRWCQ